MPLLATCTLSALTVMPAPAPTSSVLPVLVRPAPEVIWPAPENCAQVTAVVPSVPPWSAVQTQPVSALAVPCSTNVKAAGSSAQASTSVARVHAPDCAR